MTISNDKSYVNLSKKALLKRGAFCFGGSFVPETSGILAE
jgi:hypothetical protein